LVASLNAAAFEAGEVVWQRGVILKGNGLCHGLSGNGYTFLTLRRLASDQGQAELQLVRAQAFCALLEHPQLQQAIAVQPDPQRQVRGVPDSPRSLMEGAAGVICFLLDVALDGVFPGTAAFPGWEFGPSAVLGTR